jgi:hypothetical protein
MAWIAEPTGCLSATTDTFLDAASPRTSTCISACSATIAAASLMPTSSRLSVTVEPVYTFVGVEWGVGTTAVHARRSVRTGGTEEPLGSFERTSSEECLGFDGTPPGRRASRCRSTSCCSLSRCCRTRSAWGDAGTWSGRVATGTDGPSFPSGGPHPAIARTRAAKKAGSGYARGITASLSARGPRSPSIRFARRPAFQLRDGLADRLVRGRSVRHRDAVVVRIKARAPVG